MYFARAFAGLWFIIIAVVGGDMSTNINDSASVADVLFIIGYLLCMLSFKE